MKKTLSLLLVFAMLLSVCSSLLVFAEDRVNVAAGKTYVISEQFRQSNITWGYDESFPPAYPDDGGELTDGKAPADDEGYLAPGWVGFNHKTPAQTERGYAYITIDLEEVTDITGISVAYGKDTSVGITVPYWVEYFVSDDGETFEKVGYSEINPDEAKSGTNWYGFDFDAAAQYVQLRVFSYGWAFLGEIEVYGTGTAPVDPPAEEPAEEHTINVSHVNAYSWGEFYSFVITEVGKNCTNNSAFQYPCDWWYAIKVVDDTVTAIEGPGTAKTMMVEEGGFILYTYSNRADDWAAASKVEVGDVLLKNTVDLSANAYSETPIGIMTFGPKQTTDPVEPEDPPVEEPVTPSVKVEVLEGSVKFSEDALAKLFDGNDAAGATAFSDAGLVSFENTGFAHTDGVGAAVPATVAITVDMGEVKVLSKAALSAFKDSNSMIALPSVKFEVSVDGANFYDINAGGTVAPKDDLAETATATLTADFSTRVAVNARYVRVIASFRNGWLFLSEVGVTTTDAYTGIDPNAAFPYADAVSATAMGVYDAEDGELDLNKLFKNSQLIKAVYDEAAGAYKVIYSKVNPWPDGQTGFETLGDHEILVAINTGGNLVAEADETKVVSNLFSGCKWIARGLTEGDYLVFDAEAGTASFYPAEGSFDAGDLITTVKEPVEPQDPVAGEGNLVAGLEWTGDTNAGTSYVGDVTDGLISEDTSYNTTLWYGFDQRLLGDGVASMIFDMVELYNNIENVRLYLWPAGYSGIAIPESVTIYGSADGVEYTELGKITSFESTDPHWVDVVFEELVTARFIKIDFAGTGTFWFVGEVEVNAKAADIPVEPDPVPNTKVEVNVNDNEILTDGKTGFTGAWGAVGTTDVVLVTNTGCKEVGMDATLLYALGETKKIDSVTVDLYYDKNVMIGYPEGQATVLVSTDGETYTEVGKFDLTAADYSVTGTISNVFAFEAVEAAYVKVLLYAGSNAAVLGDTPADGKIFWEFISVAEFAVGEVVPEEPKIWEDTYTVLENGNAEVKIPYGYTWIIDDIDGKIGGEDTTLITNQDAYMACNPNWAITLYLEKQEDGSYLAVKNAIITPTSAEKAGITLGENQVAFVVHSSSSKPTDAETYPNWLSKVVAMSVKEGDRFIIDLNKMTVYAVIPGEDYVVPEEPVEPEIPSIGDLDGDEAITEADVEVLMGYLVGSEEAPEDLVVDLDGNGAFDIYDCVLALQYIESLAE